MTDPAIEFARSQTERRITNIVLLVGLLLSLAMAFPMMIGLKAALADGATLFFFVPFVACAVLARVIVFVSRRVTSSRRRDRSDARSRR